MKGSARKRTDGATIISKLETVHIIWIVISQRRKGPFYAGIIERSVLGAFSENYKRWKDFH